MVFKREVKIPEPCMPLSPGQREHVNRFNEKVLSGAIKFEKVPCLCGSDDFKLLARYDRYSLLQDTVICKKCGLILSNPRMTDEEYRRFYETDTYRRCYESYDYLEGYLERYNESLGRHMVDMVLKVKRPDQISGVLEFGAGGGWNLVAFKKKGFDVTGYDYSPTLVELGRKQGLNLFQGTVDSIKGKFDVIILSHVIEHFTDLRASMKKLKEHLNPDGIFYIEVPDMKNFGIGQLQNAHTYYFTLPTLEFYMSQSGLKLVYNGPAQGIHLGAIFKDGGEPLGRDFLRGRYAAQRNDIYGIIRMYYLKRSLVNFLDRIGLKKPIKRLVKR
ncbi:MAG: class I SAM-dependent methyltransferase [Candidatus Omnitrophica bacterium]|nr:class I SAM-dependent methyltransferase [Candidatus Omnitrophota bacterium]MDD5436304.1 class I SAM-dependent methyltransferase [Candidatus Omnitrophota bacterium]